MTEQQRLTIRAELARRMYPDAVIEPSPTGSGVDIRVYDKPNETRTWYNFDPFTRAEDKDALIAWLAADDDRWFDFRLELGSAMSDAGQWPEEWSFERAAMTASCETITLAAARALGIQEAGE